MTLGWKGLRRVNFTFRMTLAKLVSHPRGGLNGKFYFHFEKKKFLSTYVSGFSFDHVCVYEEGVNCLGTMPNKHYFLLWWHIFPIPELVCFIESMSHWLPYNEIPTWNIWQWNEIRFNQLSFDQIVFYKCRSVGAIFVKEKTTRMTVSVTSSIMGISSLQYSCDFFLLGSTFPFVDYDLWQCICHWGAI